MASILSKRSGPPWPARLSLQPASPSRKPPAKCTAAVVDFWPGKEHRDQLKASLRDHAFPTLGKIPVADVRTDHVVSALEQIWTSKPKTAARVRNRIEKVFELVNDGRFP